MSSNEALIDLCESSDEVEGNSESSHSPKKKTSETAVAVGRRLKSQANFWDSSSEEEEEEEEESQPTPLDQTKRNRRKSKLVTPDGIHRRTSGEVGFSSEESEKDDNGLDSHQGMKRKQPRILFSDRIKVVNLTSTPILDDPVLPSGHARAVHSNTEQKRTWELDGSSSDDESIQFVPSGLARRKNHPRKSDNLPTSTMSHDDCVVALDDSSDDEFDTRLKVGTDASKPSIPLVKSCTGLNRNHASSSSIPILSGPLSSRRFFQYPKVGPTSSRTHEDLRAKYILALWKYSRTLVSASYNLTKLDAYCRRIRDLALMKEFPIRSIGEYLGERFFSENSMLQEALTIGGVDTIETSFQRDSTVDGYYSIAEAALVGMLEYLEKKSESSSIDLSDETQLVQFCSHQDNWIFLRDLIPLIDQKLDQHTAPARMERLGEEDKGEKFYTSPSTKSAEFKQLEQLTRDEAGQAMPLLKSHRKNKRLCFELTLRGLHKARYVRDRHFPAPPSYFRTSKLYEDGVDPAFRGICLLVDHREGGGASKKLHSLCHGLDMRKVPYIVTKLDIGDYAFVSTDTQKLIPIIIERKSIQDVAQSIWDGRWNSQKIRMYQGQYVFGYENCRLSYLIEGHADGQELTGGVIGQVHFNVSRAKLDLELENLSKEGFEVITSNNVNGSLAKLAELCKRVSRGYLDGKLTGEFTYEGFMQRVRTIPAGTDFSRIAKDRQLNKAASQSVSATDTSTGRRSPSSPVLKDKPITNLKGNVANASQYNSWKIVQLKEECDKFGLSKTGNKETLIKRLIGPRPPEAWLKRKRSNLYIPSRHDTCASAILIAIWLHQRNKDDSWKGLEKEEIITLAESLEISKDPFTGTGKGAYSYDGWSCMGPLREGQCPLVFRHKGGSFKLTTVGGDISGFQIAAAMHEWCHAHNQCRCREAGQC